MEFPINYWAVLVCGIASMVTGFLWYGPLFAKAWHKEMGWGDLPAQPSQEMKDKANKAYPQQFVTALIMAYVFNHFVLAFAKAGGVELTPMLGLIGAFWTWLGFVAPVKWGETLWAGKSKKLFLIDSLYLLLNLAVFGLIIGAWH